MALHERTLTGDVDALVAHLDAAITLSSITAKPGDGSDSQLGDARMLVRVYERYSALGGNRVSLNVSMLAVGEQVHVAAIASGGSEAMFVKLNTFGEDAFLRKAAEALDVFEHGRPGTGDPYRDGELL